MESQRCLDIACSQMQFSLRKFILEEFGVERAASFVLCRRNQQFCVPETFLDEGCPDNQGRPVDLALVRSGKVYEKLGPVTIVTARVLRTPVTPP